MIFDNVFGTVLISCIRNVLTSRVFLSLYSFFRNLIKKLIRIKSHRGLKFGDDLKVPGNCLLSHYAQENKKRAGTVFSTVLFSVLSPSLVHPFSFEQTCRRGVRDISYEFSPPSFPGTRLFFHGNDMNLVTFRAFSGCQGIRELISHRTREAINHGQESLSLPSPINTAAPLPGEGVQELSVGEGRERSLI